MGSRRVPRGDGAAHSTLQVCCRALARPPSQDTLQVRPCKLRGGIHAAKGPATVSEQGPVAMIGAQSLSRAVGDCPARVCSLFNTPPANYLVRRPRRLRDRWRHGCRHRAPMDGFTACPASGEGTAHSTLQVCCGALARSPSQDTLQVRPCKLRGGIHAAKGPATVSGQGPVEMVGAQSLNRAVGNCPARVCSLLNKPPANYLVRCPRRLRDRWRHGCRHRAPMDGFTACPASGEGTAHSTPRVLLQSPCQSTLARHTARKSR